MFLFFFFSYDRCLCPILKYTEIDWHLFVFSGTSVKKNERHKKKHRVKRGRSKKNEEEEEERLFDLSMVNFFFLRKTGILE